MQENEIIGTSLIIIGIIWFIGFLALHFFIQARLNRQKTFVHVKRVSLEIWEFTKRNILFMFALFGIVFIITGGTMLING